LNKPSLKANETSSESFHGKNSEINFIGDMGPRKAVSMPLAINSLWSTWGGKLQGLILFQWTGHPGLSKGVEVMDIQGRGVGTNIVLGRWDVLVCPRVERMKKSWIQGEK